MGRPSSLTPATHRAIVEALELGNSKENAARMAGVHPATLYRWLSAGQEEDEGRYRELYDEVTRACARAENVVAGALWTAAQDDYKAAVEWLKRRSASEWSAVKITKVEVQNGVQQVLEAVEPHMSREAYAELVRAVAVVQGVDEGEASTDQRLGH